MTAELRLSRTLQYAVILLSELAIAEAGEKLAISDIAERTGIPEGSLRILVQRLRKEGFLGSSTGKGGGISLHAEPSEITVADLAEVFEGEATASERLLALCALGGNEPSCSIWAWRLTADRIREHLETITIEDLATQILSMSTAALPAEDANG